MIGTDWLVRLVSPRVIRRPRGDSARVKLNIEMTRRLTIVTTPMASGIRAEKANWTTWKTTVAIPATIRKTVVMIHSDDSSSPKTSRWGDTVTRGWSVAPRSVRRLAGASSSRSLSRACSPWARVSR